MPKRTRNFTQLFKASFSSFLASIAIANEADELILNEAGEQIVSDPDEIILAQGHTAGRLGGNKTAITRSTGGFTA